MYVNKSKIMFIFNVLLCIATSTTYLFGVDRDYEYSVVKQIQAILNVAGTQRNRLLRRSFFNAHLNRISTLVEPILEIGSSNLQLLDLGRSPMRIGILEGVVSMKRLRKIKGVRFVEKDQALFSSSISEQYQVPSYGLARVSSREIDSSVYTFDSSAGYGVDVYVLDSGINARHEDFEGRAFVSRNFITTESSEDFYGHGTHVAGTVAGQTFGVAKNAQVYGVKILNKSGEGTVSLAVQALSHVIKMARRSGRKSIINLSLAGTFSQALNVAVNNAFKENIPIIAAAGNQRTNACLTSPASASNVLAVGATDFYNTISSSSNFGPCIAIFAPGKNIISTSSFSNTESRSLSGTSMAAPHVAGIAALFWSQLPYLTPKELYEAVLTRGTGGVINGLSSDTINLLAYNKL